MCINVFVLYFGHQIGIVEMLPYELDNMLCFVLITRCVLLITQCINVFVLYFGNETVNTTCQRHMVVTDAFWEDSQCTNVHLNVIVIQFYYRFN